jgi:siroheme synthase
VVTGHCEDPNESVNWSAHAKTGATLVVLMGTANLPKISADLLSAGMAPSTPVAIIYNGTRADQTISRLTLTEAHLAEAQAPSIIVIGETAGLDLRDPQTVSELIATGN